MTVYSELPLETRNFCTFCLVTHLTEDNIKTKKEDVLKFFIKKKAVSRKSALKIEEFYKECNVDSKFIYENLIGDTGILVFRKDGGVYKFWLKPRGE